MASGLHWTEAQLRDAQARRGVSAGAPPPHLPLVKGALKPRKMNKAEAQYDAILRANKDVVWSGFEVITLRLADDTRYTPDFAVLLSDGSMEMHEVKGGFVREDAWVKLKIAAGMFPFRFRMAQKVKADWTVRAI